MAAYGSVASDIAKNAARKMSGVRSRYSQSLPSQLQVAWGDDHGDRDWNGFYSMMVTGNCFFVLFLCRRSRGIIFAGKITNKFVRTEIDDI